MLIFEILFIYGLASIFGAITKTAAIRFGRNPIFWRRIGFYFGLLGVLLLLITVIVKGNKTIKPIQKPQLPHYSLNPGAWYYSKENLSYGPVSADYINKLAKEDLINDQTLVWNESLTEWTRLSHFKI